MSTQPYVEKPLLPPRPVAHLPAGRPCARAAVARLVVEADAPAAAADFHRRLTAALEHQARAIGQSLHDDAAQLLTAAHIALAEVARDLPAPAGQRLLDVRRHLAAVEEHLRHVAHELRPRVLDDLGIVPALEFLASGFEARRNIRTTVRTRLPRRLPDSVETAVYRVVQEGLTNIGRHACATRACICLGVASQLVTCMVCDDGVGFDVRTAATRRPPGLGLQGIRERLEALGGALRVISAEGTGTQLIASIPLER